MTESMNKDLVRRYYEEIVSSGDVARIEEFIGSDYVEVYQSKRYELGLAGAREHVTGVRKVYPDIRLTVDRQIAEGEWVASCVTMRGTQRGEWMGIKPTGKTIEVTGVNVDRVVDGRIVEHGGAANMLEALLAIGSVEIVKR